MKKKTNKKTDQKFDSSVNSLQEVYKILRNTCDNKSQTIRGFLTYRKEDGSRMFSRSQVADIMNIRYQHVRNVEIMPLTSQQ